MAMSLSFCRTRTTDKSKHMSHTHAAARSFDLARHPSRCETVELSNREVLDSSTVSQQQHGAKRHCVGFLTTQAFYPPPNKVAKRLSSPTASHKDRRNSLAFHTPGSIHFTSTVESRVAGCSQYCSCPSTYRLPRRPELLPFGRYWIM